VIVDIATAAPPAVHRLAGISAGVPTAAISEARKDGWIIATASATTAAATLPGRA
jgi:hypothetical protein